MRRYVILAGLLLAGVGANAYTTKTLVKTDKVSVYRFSTKEYFASSESDLDFEFSIKYKDDGKGGKEISIKISVK